MNYYYTAVLIQVILLFILIIFRQFNDKYLKKYLGEDLDHKLYYLLIIIVILNSIYIRISWFRITRFYFKHHR